MTLEERLRTKIQQLAPKGAPWDKVADAVMTTSKLVIQLLLEDSKEKVPLHTDYQKALEEVIRLMPANISEVREIDIGRRKN